MYFTFEQPIYLWLLLAVPILIFSHFYWLRHAKGKALKFANFVAIKRVAGKKLLTKNYTLLFIRVFLLMSLILCVSVPIYWFDTDVNNYDYIIAIDSSASMSAADFSPSRLEVAKRGSIGFVKEISAETDFGVVSFSGTTFIQTPLTSAAGEVERGIDNIDLIRAGGTDIPGAIITSSNLLSGSKRSKAIILITDGSTTSGSLLDDGLEQAINYARDKNVRVFTLGIGSEQGPIGYIPEYYNVSSVFDESTLQQISEDTKGQYFKIDDVNDLTDALSTLASDTKEGTTSRNLTLAFGALALFLLLLDWTLTNTRFRRIP